MKKLIALVLVLGLLAAAPVMAADTGILAGVSQYEVTALADTEMSQIQGESGGILLLGLKLNLSLYTSAAVLGLVGGILGAVLALLGGVI